MERIIAVAREMGYDSAYHHAARSLRYSQLDQRVLSHVVALFFPLEEIQVPYFAALFRGLQEVLSEEKYALITNLTSRGSAECALPAIFSRGDVDGAILLDHDRVLQQLLQEPAFGSRPLLSMIHALPGCSSVVADDYHGAYIAAQHLLSLGHHHILHYYDDRYALYRQRFEGICQACWDAGLDPASALHYLPWPKTGVASAVNATLEYLYAHREVRALLMPNDYMAVRAIPLLQQAGLHIPEDISIVGFDDTEAWLDANGGNHLTTVQVPIMEIGRVAARTIIRRITGELEEDTVITLSTALVCRSSTAQPGCG